MNWYTLNENKQPVPVTIEELARRGLPPSEDWRVGWNEIGDSQVSTVFLGLDHRSYPSGRPILFETMVFGGPLAGEMERYCTWEEAEEGHRRMVERVKAWQ